MRIKKEGQEYKVIGTLMDKGTDEPIVIDGKKVKAEKTFKAKKPKGKVEVMHFFEKSIFGVRPHPLVEHTAVKIRVRMSAIMKVIRKLAVNL